MSKLHDPQNSNSVKDFLGAGETRDLVDTRKKVINLGAVLAQWISHLLANQVTQFQFPLTTVAVKPWLAKQLLGSPSLKPGSSSLKPGSPSLKPGSPSLRKGKGMLHLAT